MGGPTQDAAELAEAVARLLRENKQTVAVAESLTSGKLASRLGAAPEASNWFAGGVVAYAAHVKFEVLGVEPGPVVTAQCARQMARGVLRLLRSDFGLAVTGVGGPDPDEGKPAGTVFVSVATAGREEVAEYHFDGDPAAVLEQSAEAALSMLLATIEPRR
ncbi:CinA family protein [Kribbella sp. NPDC023855]|uniref:CinA family protein n=1 Tax=Kribbella sp. NPDC023855 TaxID=3154698 RepID=UPI0033C713D6